MSKKHYQAIAAIIAGLVPPQSRRDDPASVIEYLTARDAARRLADYFAADNPRFDRERFLAACGVEQ